MAAFIKAGVASTRLHVGQATLNRQVSKVPHLKIKHYSGKATHLFPAEYMTVFGQWIQSHSSDTFESAAVSFWKISKARLLSQAVEERLEWWLGSKTYFRSVEVATVLGVTPGTVAGWATSAFSVDQPNPGGPFFIPAPKLQGALQWHNPST